MLKVVAAFGKAMFVTVILYVIAGLTLFAAGASIDIPGVISSHSGTHDDRFETSLSFQPEVGAFLVVILTAAFFCLPAAIARGARSSR